MLTTPVKKHPAATIGGSGGGVAVFLIWILTAYARVPLSATQGAAIATAFATALLVFGRHGLKGLWQAIWDGWLGQGDEQ